MLGLKKRPLDMTEGPIFLGMIRFAIPLILSGILNQLFNTADTLMVGRWGGDTPEECEHALAAVGSCSALITTIVALFTGLSVGTSVCVARERGAKDEVELQKTVRTVVTISFACGLICMLVGMLGAKPILTLMGTDEALLEDAASYMRIYFVGIPASMTYSFCSAILTSSGDSTRPLIFLSTAGAVNVGLNAMMIIGFGMGAFGVGLATAISHWVSLAMILIYMSRMDDHLCRIPWRNLGVDWKKMCLILRIGIPASLQGAMFSFSNVFTQSAVNAFGPATVAGNTAAANVETYLAFVQSGVSQSGSVYIGQNAGAKNFARVKRAILWGVLLATCVGLAMGIAVYFNVESILGLYIPDGEEAILAGATRIRVLFLLHFLYGIMSLGTSALRGMGKNLLPTAMMIGGCCVYRILWISFLYRPFFEGNLTALYLVYPTSWVITNIAVYIALAFVYRKLRRQNDLTLQAAMEPTTAEKVISQS